MLPSFSTRFFTLCLAALVLASCSPAAKKARALERADRYFKAGDYDKAKIEYMNVLRVDRQKAMAILQQSPGNGEALGVLVETARVPEEIDHAAQQLLKSPERDNVSFQL